MSRVPHNTMLMLAALLLAWPRLARGQDAADLVCFDFENGATDGWRVVDGAFGAYISDRAEYHHHGGAYNKHGSHFFSTLEAPDGHPEDRYTGIAESPVFELTAPEMRMLVGGGNHPTTYVALCTAADDREVARASGINSQVMQERSWQQPELVGQRVYLRIVDRHRGGWGHVTFDDFRASGRIDAEASARRQQLQARRRALAALASRLGAGGVAGIRAAIQDLHRRFPERYAGARAYLSELDTLEAEWDRLSTVEAPSAKELERLGAIADEVEALRRRALLANPLLLAHPILFVVREQYRPDHHNTATLFQTGECNTGSFRGGGALKTIDLTAAGRVTTLLAVPEGVVRDPEVHVSGTRVVISLRHSVTDDYHICEIGADGRGLRQLTAAPGVSDVDPVYLADGDIVFSSTREPKYCMCNRHIMANLFRMGSAGANVHQIGKSTLFEGHAALMPDGRILYDRWEYVDRNFGDAQGLWTVNPDGTNHALYWGNNTNSPGGVIDARIMPGGHRAICVFGSCHDRPWGALALLDRRLGVDGRTPVVMTWPRSAIDLVGRGNYDTFKQVRPRYEDPYPLSDAHILCSRTVADSEATGIYLVDVFGNEILIHAEAPGCFDPMPLGPSPLPPVVPPRRTFDAAPGSLYVLNVYEGTHMAGITPGSVRFLRVVESPEKRYWTVPAWGGQGVHRPAMNWHSFENKRILGTVPVHPDGSVAVQLPAERFVFFQLLDEQGMMVQSMRSGTMVQPGETTGCVGCHEHRLTAPPAGAKMPAAMQGPPARLAGWFGPERTFSYRQEVQPVFDRHCVRCHDFGKPAGDKVVLAGDRTMTFNASYNELWRRRLIRCVGGGPAAVQQARSWGSHASPLVDVLRKGHQEVRLTAEEFARIVTWIDLNGPYYPTYASAYPDHLGGRCPLTPAEVRRLTELTGVPFAKLAAHHTNRGPQVSFDRPAKSPCLHAAAAAADDRVYAEALALIERGAARLRERPRADSVGFAPCAVDETRAEKYRLRVESEQASRAALRAGGTVYDSGVQ